MIPSTKQTIMSLKKKIADERKKRQDGHNSQGASSSSQIALYQSESASRFFTPSDRAIPPFDDRATNPNSGTIFLPLDYCAPGGHLETEYNQFRSIVQQDRTLWEVCKHSSSEYIKLFHSHVGQLFDPIAAGYSQSQQHAAKSYRSRYTRKNGYIDLRNFDYYLHKWSRFICSREPRPEEIYENSTWTMFTFAPVEYEHAYTNEYGLEIQVTGRFKKGHAGTLRIINFVPYMYMRVPPSWLPDRFYILPPRESNFAPLPCVGAPDLSIVEKHVLVHRMKHLHERLERTLYDKMTDWEKKKYGCDSPSTKVITDIHIEKHISAFSYQGLQPVYFFKISTRHPSFIRKIRILLQLPHGSSFPGFKPDDNPDIFPPLFEDNDSIIPPELVPARGFDVFEAHNDFIVRFLTDTNTKPCRLWFVGSDFARYEIPRNERVSLSDLEFVVDWRNIVTASQEYANEHDSWFMDVKFDIESESSDRFPHPDTNPVTMISVRGRFGPLGKVEPENNSKIVNCPLGFEETVRLEPCTIAIVFTLGSVDGDARFAGLQFSHEEDMLMAFYELMVVLRPDIISGHASNIFDFNYLLRRAEKFKLTAFPYFTRYIGKKVQNNSESERAEKKGLCRPITVMNGVTVWDSLNYATDFAFAKDRSLNTLCKEALGKGKIDVEYTLISAMMKNKVGRTGLAIYCNHDVVLTELLDDKQSSFRFIKEMADMCSIPGQKVLDRASIFRILGLWTYNTQRYYSKILQKKMPLLAGSTALTQLGMSLSELQSDHIEHDPDISLIRFLTPTKHVRGRNFHENEHAMPGSVFGDQLLQAAGKGFVEDTDDDGYEGGKVLPPIKGMYLFRYFLFLTVLDFTSLYPSIIRRLNLCYTTYVAAKEQEFVCAVFKLDIWADLWHVPHFLLREDQMTTEPYIDLKNKPSFIRKHVQDGLTAIIEEMVMKGRSATKAKMGKYYKAAKLEIDPQKKAGLLYLAGRMNLRQLAEKIICNSIYGYFGTTMSNFPLKEVAETITNVARQALEFTRYHIFRTCRRSNGWKFNALIAYGDTDSVFVLMMDLDTFEIYFFKITKDQLTEETIDVVTQEMERELASGEQINKGKLMDEVSKRVSERLKTELLLKRADNVEESRRMAAEGAPLTREEFKDFCFNTFSDVQKSCNAFYGDPMNLDVEKTGDALLNEAKCYALFRAEGAAPFDLKFSGLSYVRRGGCLLQRQLCHTINRLVVKENRPRDAIEHVRDVIARVRNMELEMHEIIMASTLSKNPDAYETPSPPPHVKLAMQMLAAGAAPLRAGDRIFYVVTPAHKTSRVFEKVESPLNVLRHRIPYDVDYYLNVVLKEAKKNLRSVVDPRSFVEVFLYTEEIRKLLARPDGKDLVTSKKNELRKMLDKEVERAVLYGMEVQFEKFKKPSLYDLPQIYQNDLPPAKYHWCGDDPKERLQSIEDYIPPWAAIHAHSHEMAKETDILDEKDERGEIEFTVAEDEFAYYGDIPLDDLDLPPDTFEPEGKYGDFEKKTEKADVARFVAMFAKTTHKKRKYNWTSDNGDGTSSVESDVTTTNQLDGKAKKRRTVKKESTAKKGAIDLYLVKMTTCVICKKDTPFSNLDVCETCNGSIHASGEKITIREKKKQQMLMDIEDLATTYDSCYQTCIACVTKELGYWQPALIEECSKFVCPDNGRRWKNRATLEEKIKEAEKVGIHYVHVLPSPSDHETPICQSDEDV